MELKYLTRAPSERCSLLISRNGLQFFLSSQCIPSFVHPQTRAFVRLAGPLNFYTRWSVSKRSNLSVATHCVSARTCASSWSKVIPHHPVRPTDYPSSGPASVSKKGCQIYVHVARSSTVSLAPQMARERTVLQPPAYSLTVVVRDFVSNELPLKSRYRVSIFLSSIYLF
jgi:hypothetical protein